MACANARNSLKWNSRASKLHSFFTATAKNEWISAFETHHAQPFLSLFDEEMIDPVLAHGVAASALAHIDFFAIRARVAEQSFIGKEVVNDTVRPLEERFALQCEKADHRGQLRLDRLC